MLPPDPAWPQASKALSLSFGEVHVWRVDLRLSAAESEHRTGLLSADERERAGRFLVEHARTEFVAARSALRSILARYLGREPRAIAFALGSLGKPSLADPGREPLYFNLSHSHGLALVAVTRRGEIGADVEQVRELVSADDLAGRFFHPNEVVTLRGLRPDQRMRGFFNAWTRKEAFLKATGKGISYGIDRVEVTLRPGEPPRVLGIDGDARAAAGWTLESLEPAPGYVGAVAIVGGWDRLARYSCEIAPRK